MYTNISKLFIPISYYIAPTLLFLGIIDPLPSTDDSDPTGSLALQNALEQPPGKRPRLQGKPSSIAEFLLKYTEGNLALDKGMIGDFMGEGNQYNVDILHCYTELLVFDNMEIDDGIRYFLKEFRLPGEAQKVDRMMEKFAQVYYNQYPGIFDSPETAFVLSFSIIMLNTDLHNPNIKEDRKMTKEGFIRNNRGIASGRDLPPDYLMGIFDRIQKDAISLKEDDELRMAAARTAGSKSGGVKAKRLAMQADMQKEAVDRLHNKRKTGASNIEPGAWMNNMYFTMTDVLSSRNADYVRPMFGLLWDSSLKVYTLLLTSAASDDKVVDLCLQGLRFGIRVSGVFKMELERRSYVKILSNFACLDTNPDRYMSRVNVESVKVILSVAMSEGEHLGDSWSLILNVVSEVARLFVIAETGGDDQSSHFVEQQRRRSINGASNSSDPRSPTVSSTGGRLSSRKAAASARKVEEKRMKRKEIELRNSLLISKNINFQELERIFTSSTSLANEAIVDFMKCLSIVAKHELIGDTIDVFIKPRVFSLQKLVEMADYNMNIRGRVVWSRLWSHISNLFEEVGAHPNVLISMYAIDSLKQLSIKFLEKKEIGGFHFQQVFMTPFEKIMNKNPNLEIRELVLSVINNIIQLRHSNIMSGWKIIFSVYSAAANDTSRTLNNASFNAMSKLIQDHWELVYPNFVDIINCFASFAKNTSITSNTEENTTTNKNNNNNGNNNNNNNNNENENSNTSLSAIKQILRLTQKLVEGTNDIRCDEHGSLLSIEQQEQQKLLEMENKAATETESSSKYRFTDSADHSRVWFPILTCLARLIVDQRKDIRRASLFGLFEILNFSGSDFSPSLWELIFKGVLFPIFNDVTHSEEGESDRFIKEWLDTTCQDALNLLVGLFETKERYVTLSFLLNDVMHLVRTCIVHPNKLLARKGVVCLQQLLVDSGHFFPEQVWNQVCDNMSSLLKSTTPQELMDSKIIHDNALQASIHEENGTNAVVQPTLPFSPSKVLAKCIVQLELVGVVDKIVQKHWSSFTGYVFKYLKIIEKKCKKNIVCSLY